MNTTYSLGNFIFETEKFFPPEIFFKINEIRASGKARDIVLKEAAERKRCRRIARDGKLTILAADHPARKVTAVGDNPIAMGDRLEYLGRVLRVITNPKFDGIMGTTDIIEDLFIVNHLFRKGGSTPFLDAKVIVGCMNRGGLAGTIYELDDRMTSFTAASIKTLKLDGAKLMFRLCDDEIDAGRTIEYCAKAINDLNKYGITVFLEVLPLIKENGKYKTQKTSEELVKSVGVASALGDSSLNIWLKIPYCEKYELVSRATTCPILMLGGESKGNPIPVLEEFYKGLNVGGSVRGALVGRNITFPGKEDPLAVALAVNGIVHNDLTVEEAVEIIMDNRGKNMNLLIKSVKI